MTEINRTPKHSHIIIIAPSLNRKTDRLLLLNRLMMPASPPIAPAHIKVSKTPHFAHQIFASTKCHAMFSIFISIERQHWKTRAHKIFPLYATHLYTTTHSEYRCTTNRFLVLCARFISSAVSFYILSCVYRS